MGGLVWGQGLAETRNAPGTLELTAALTSRVSHELLFWRALDMPTQQEIYSKVSATLVEALNVDEEEIKPTSTLQGDLGAESIDFLDIVFRLEREFGIK